MSTNFQTQLILMHDSRSVPLCDLYREVGLSFLRVVDKCNIKRRIGNPKLFQEVLNSWPEPSRWLYNCVHIYIYIYICICLYVCICLYIPLVVALRFLADRTKRAATTIRCPGLSPHQKNFMIFTFKLIYNLYEIKEHLLQILIKTF